MEICSRQISRYKPEQRRIEPLLPHVLPREKTDKTGLEKHAMFTPYACTPPASVRAGSVSNVRIVMHLTKTGRSRETGRRNKAQAGIEGSRGRSRQGQELQGLPQQRRVTEALQRMQKAGAVSTEMS